MARLSGAPARPGSTSPATATVRRGFDGPFAELQRVERRAASVSSSDDLPPAMRDDALPVEAFELARDEGLLWVAEASGEAVGFVLLCRLDGHLHVREMDVVPELARRGIGRALMDAALEHARASGVREITLTTFEHLPWNRRFYERHGFVVVSDADAPPPVVRELRAERAAGLRRRVAMILRIDTARPAP